MDHVVVYIPWSLELWHGDYNWVQIAFSTNDDTGDDPVFSSSLFVPTVGSNRTSVAIIMEFLV